MNIFFCLSGFLITSLLYREKEKRGQISLLNFYKKRALRLGPPLIVFYLLLLLMRASKILFPAKIEIVASLFYFYNYVPTALRTSEMAHMWSLAVEEQFYLFWPILLRKVSWTTAKTFGLIILGLSAAMFYFEKRLGHFSEDFRIYQWIVPAIGPIMMGSLAGMCAQKAPTQIMQITNKKLWMFMAVVAFMSPLILPTMLLPIHPVTQSFATAWIMLWVYFHQTSRAVRILEWPLLAYVGKISYGLYLFQGLFLGTASFASPHVVHKFPLNVLLTFVVAVLSYSTVEAWARRQKGKLFRSCPSENDSSFLERAIR